MYSDEEMDVGTFNDLKLIINNFETVYLMVMQLKFLLKQIKIDNGTRAKSTAGRIFALKAVYSRSIPAYHMVPPALQGVISEC